MGTYESAVDLATGGIMNVIAQSSDDDLRAMVQDDSRLEGLVRDTPQVRAMESEREALLRANKSLAQSNITLEPKLREAKKQLLQTYDTAAQLRRACEELKAGLETIGESRSLDTTQVLLETAAREAEENSEKLAENMLAGDIEVEEFLTSFLAERGRAHARRIKADRMGEVLRGQGFAAPAPLPYPVPAARRRPPPPPPSAFPCNYTL